MKRVSLVMVLTVIAVGPVSGRVIHVPADSSTIQAGINGAQDGDTVLVADGTYKGDGNKNLDFGGKAILVTSENGPDSTIIDCENDGRGFYFHSGEGLSSMVSGFTIRNGAVDDGGGGIYCYSYSSPTITNCVITGNFTSSFGGGGICCRDHSSPIIKGNTISGNSVSQGSGGGIYCYGYSSPTIEGNIISGNMIESPTGAVIRGGGICCTNYSSPAIIHNTITGNTVTSVQGSGGGISFAGSTGAPLARIDGNTISGNEAPIGGGIYFSDEPCFTITNNTISNNQAGWGGGIYAASSAIIYNCIITGNNVGTPSGGGSGGGICCYGCSPTITSCVVSACTSKSVYAAAVGGGITCYSYGGDCNPIITNCIISENIVTSEWTAHGGGIYCAGDGVYTCEPTITNCTITKNSAIDTVGFYWAYGGGISCFYYASPTVINTILWEDTATGEGNEIYLDDYSSITITYSDIQDGWEGTGNIDADPLFVTGPKGDYYLSQIAAGQALQSPSVDSGSDLASNLGMDSMTTRTDEQFDTGIVDMGFHYTVAVPKPDIQLSDTMHDFGNVGVGDSTDWTLIVSNVGDTTLIVDNIVSDNPVFTIPAPNFPQNILPGDSIDVTVRFLPTAETTYSGTLTVVSNDPDESLLYVSLQGTGTCWELELIDVVNYPNPFGRDGTKFTYQLCKEAAITVKIYTVTGEHVRTLSGLETSGNAGYNEAVWDGKNKYAKEVAPGIYIYQIIAEDEQGKTMSKIRKCAKSE